MKEFVTPRLELLPFKTADILTASVGTPETTTAPHGPETPGDDFE